MKQYLIEQTDPDNSEEWHTLAKFSNLEAALSYFAIFGEVFYVTGPDGLSVRMMPSDGDDGQ